MRTNWWVWDICITWWLCTYRPVRREDLRRCRWQVLCRIPIWRQRKVQNYHPFMPAVVPARATHRSTDKTMSKGCSLFPNMFTCKNGIMETLHWRVKKEEISAYLTLAWIGVIRVLCLGHQWGWAQCLALSLDLHWVACQYQKNLVLQWIDKLQLETGYSTTITLCPI